MHEGRHDPAGAGAGHAPGDGHLGQIADALADARVELGFGRGQRLPISRIGDVLEEVDRRMDRADDADRARPGHAADRHIHQAPRSASRYARRSIRSVISPRSMMSSALRPAKAAFGLRIQA